jgi:DNA-binding Lrp family transcriptional regulator
VVVDGIADIDRAMLQQLARSPRASYRELGRSIGVPDHAVRRRYLAMQQGLGLRVTAREVRESRGLDNWVVRIKAEPACVKLLGRSLAARADTRWVRSAAGETELVAGVQTHAELGDVLTPMVDQLPALRRPQSISAHLMLADLGQRERTQLRDPATWTDFDDRLLAELRRDGRATAALLAVATGSHESTVRRRIAQLMRAGLIEFDVDLDENAVGIGVTALLWLRIDMARLDLASTTIAGHDEVAFAAVITGECNLFVAVACTDVGHLYRYLTDHLANVEGVRDVDTAPISRTFKRSGALGAGWGR